MPVNDLLNIPATVDQWAIFSFANKTINDRIRQAIFSQTNGKVNLFQYQLDPINFDDFTSWLQNNQSTHDNFNEVLNLQGVDLEGVDIKDANQLQAWVYLNWQEIQSACLALGI